MVYFEGNILYEVIQEIEVIVHIVPGSNEAPHFQRVQLTGLKTRMSSRGTGVILINHAMGSSWHSTKPGARGCTWGETSLVRIQAGGWTDQQYRGHRQALLELPLDSHLNIVSPDTSSTWKAPHRNMDGHIPAHSCQSNFFHKCFQVPSIPLHFGMAFERKN